jgi:uncharacterized protein (TIGR02996 family)
LRKKFGVPPERRACYDEGGKDLQGQGMSERGDLLRAILESPEDDAPRLVFADWLEEQGDTMRAEFIRIQCAMAHYPEGTSRNRPLQERSIQLERFGRTSWAEELQGSVLGLAFRRGFVDEVQLTAENFLLAAEKLLQIQPIRVWEFRPPAFFQRGIPLTNLAQSPSIEKVRVLKSSYYSADELLMTLARSAKLEGLQGLTIAGQYPHSESILALFNAAPNLCELEALDASMTNLRDLWRRGTPSRIKKLSLIRSRVTDFAVEQLARSPASASIESLSLDLNQIGERGAEALAASEYLTNLKELSLAETQIGDVGVATLALSPILKQVRLLNLSQCQLDDMGANAIADSRYLNHLKYLCLDGNRVSIEIETKLVERFGREACSFYW